jgi:hypothetical protein
MKTRLMALLLVAGGTMFAQSRFSVGVNIGGPVVYAPGAAYNYRPPCPGPEYVWIEGYYDGYGNWIEGYWALPPYVGAYWVAPRLLSGRFFAGYWGGGRREWRREPRHEERRDFRPPMRAPEPMPAPREFRRDNRGGGAWNQGGGGQERNGGRDRGPRGGDNGRGFRR